MDVIEIEIIQWDKHQPRKDIKHPTWFALSNHILDDAKLFGLTDSEWKALLYFFCQASQQNSAKISINLSHAKRVCEISEKTMRSALEKLAYAGVTSAYGSRTDAYRDIQTDTTNKTNKTDTSVPTVPVRESFDFEALYRKYPKREGKQKGIEKCKAQIKTLEDFEGLSLAIDRYSTKLIRDATEARFIKHFSSFMVTWRDWLDPAHGSSVDFGGSKLSPAAIKEAALFAEAK